MQHYVTYRQARARLGALIDRVIDSRDPIVIRGRGREPVALVAAEDLAGWLETAYLLRSPKNARRLLEADRPTSGGHGELPRNA